MNDLKEIGGFIVSADPFVQHDNSLSGNGTVNSPLGVNETVLWENTNGYTPGDGSGTTDIELTMPESLNNFEYIRICLGGTLGGVVTLYPRMRSMVYIAIPESGSVVNGLMINILENNTTNKVRLRCGYSSSWNTAYHSGQDWGYYTIYKIIGVNRIANN